MAIAHPYLMFLGEARDQLAAKTAQGIVHWRPDWCLGQLRLPGCQADLRIPDLTLEEAKAAGARTVIVGVANRGGKVAGSWTDTLVRALELGMDLASGLHRRLADIPPVAEAARRLGRQLFDVRHPTREFDVGTGARRPGKRLLAVGTDCSVGKMYTTLALEREMKRRGMKADFRATGQTGIFIAGEGVSIDAVVADFISGAVEWLSPANDPDHWDLIEGQGSLFHASYAGVSLGLLHGAQPDLLILCHEPTRRHMRGLPHFPLPDLQACIEANLAAARLTNPGVRCIAASINTGNMSEAEAEAYLAKTEARLGMPAVDPVRTGVARIVDLLG
ncbi:MAG TPA: N-acetyltransferase DgcN [Dongiaceae bacterium]|nr:N-acetyltransferase DgcN [Dongiaceae bacterium]